MMRLTRLRGGFDEEHVAEQLGRQPIATIHRGRADGRERRERFVGAEHAVLVAAIDAWRRPYRPGHVQVAGVERLVAAARAQQVRISRVVRRRHDVHEQRRRIRVAIDAAGVVLRCRPTGRATASSRLRTCRPSAAGRCRLRTCASSCRAPTVNELALCSTFASSWPYLSVTDSFVSARRSPLVSRASHRLGGSATRTPRSEHLERARQHELVEEDGLLVHLSVGVGVLQHADAAGRLALRRRRHVFHVSRHLDDPQPSIGSQSMTTGS